MFTRSGMLLTAALAGIVLALASSAFAHDKARECKPSGAPNLLGQTGAVGVAQPVAYWSKPWLLLADKQERPDKLRLVSASGEVVEIGKPPITVEPVAFLARGRGVYALSKGRSQTPGKTDVVLMRWGTDPRPRLTNVRTGVIVEGQLSAAFENEFLALSWAERASDGALHRMLSIVDSEDVRVSDPKDLGPDSAALARVQPLAKGFVVLWTSQKGLMRATFDQFGKATAPVATLAWSGPIPVDAAVLGLAQCADRSFLARQIGQELVLSFGDANGALKDLTHLPYSPALALSSMECVDGSLVVGRRTLDSKAGNVAFSVATIDAAGHVRERRVKETRGNADEIRMPQLSLAGDALTSFWIQGQGADAKVWSRELRCE